MNESGPLMKEHVHGLPGSEAAFSSGSYTVGSEGRLAYNDRELLYVEGVLTAGSACCGAIECRIIRVPGLIVSWRSRKDEVSGRPVSIVEPLVDPAVRKDVERMLSGIFPSSLIVLE